MKNTKTLKRALMLCLMLSMTFLFGISASAEVTGPTEVTMYFRNGKTLNAKGKWITSSFLIGENWLLYDGLTKDFYIDNETSSNPKVSVSEELGNGLRVWADKKLTNGEQTLISFEVRTDDDNDESVTVQTISCLVTFRKEGSPVKNLKMGGKNVKINNKHYIEYNKKIPSKIKTKFTLKNGYKLLKLQAAYAPKQGKLAYVKVKNGASISKTYKGMELYGFRVFYTDSWKTPASNYTFPKGTGKFTKNWFNREIRYRTIDYFIKTK